MPFAVSADRFRFLYRQLLNHLWVRPAVVCVLSIIAAITARSADRTALATMVPKMSADSIESLLSLMAASMLVIATFAVASMVAAYSSASSTATPRSFTLIVSDDVSQNALSTFLGAFIYSIVAVTAMRNNYYGDAATFIIFVLTALVFIAVVLTFVRWVDRIARLGRLGTTIDKVENATADAIRRRLAAPTLIGAAIGGADAEGVPMFTDQVGYVQHIDMEALQRWAERAEAQVDVVALQGTFVTPDRALAHVRGSDENVDMSAAIDAFLIGGDRIFDDDPRFGLVALAEIAGRALSTGINDPGTAIDVIGTAVRLFVLWNMTGCADRPGSPQFERIHVPELATRDMFDDAFTAIARDGAGSVEVALRLQKALGALSRLGNEEMRSAALHHSRLALARAEKALVMDEDKSVVRQAAKFSADAA